MPKTRSNGLEFIVLVALLNAMVAMSIDTMLPAIGAMATELGATDPNSRQFIITSFFGGLTIGTLIYGPLSDSLGRKPMIYWGLVFYAIGGLICMMATSFPMILIGRVIQGLGAAGPRIVSIAMVRDGQGGAAMARIMSFVMTVFMLVPILAPSIGQLVLMVASWRVIFAGLLVIGVIAAVWLALRQEETLPKEKRAPLSLAALIAAGRETVTTPVTMAYTLGTGCVFGSFVCYLGTAQQIFVEQYDQGAYFPLWFGCFAVAIAISMILNGRFVMKLGMRRISKWALRTSIVVSAVFLLAGLTFGGHPPMWMLGLYLFTNFFCCGILFGNYNAMSLEPVGHIAGTAASISGALSTLFAIISGTIIGQAYDGTVIPLAAGFTGLGILAFFVTEWAEWRRPKPGV
jgi:DHA1 family bicyclomycin/chloramphenicol resistance-like MFS transporter